MSVLLPFNLLERQAATAPDTSLGGLADGLAAELLPLEQALARGQLPVPAQKARLTRIGGRCPEHGVLLDFDPWRPHHHHCARCARDYMGREHDDWWAMNVQLWTVERAVHAAALHLLRGTASHAHLAESILRVLADGYTQWPNRDNVLGPSRPFFSTYLESIWLLNVAHALTLLEAAGRDHVGGLVRERLLEPSSALIAGFPEGRSNRQVWNEVAVLSAWTLLGRESAIASRLSAPGSVPWLLEHGLLEDGSWYEGENYHLFAHRGLWYGVQWMRATGRALRPALDARFHRGFAAPFVGVLPDETLPARRDSQYAVTIRQWRVAEYLELGCAHRPDRGLAAWLGRLYAPMPDTPNLRRVGRQYSTADAERHDPPGPLSRADLSWRALLMASKNPVADTASPLVSAHLPSQGLAVMRRDGGRVYVALEGGATGGGHGHPDRLALTLQIGAGRVLDDPGTGSYVERTLHWYRSTLAHHAPLVDGQSQQRQPATLLAFEDRGGAGWMRKTVIGLAPGVTVTRTVIVCDGHIVDVLEWEADHTVTLSLPVAAHANVEGVHTWRPVERPGAGGLEDGFNFLRDVTTACDADGGERRSAGAPFAWSASHARAWYAASAPARLLRAEAPTAPLSSSLEPSRVSLDSAPAMPHSMPRHWLEVEAARGSIVGVWAWTPGAAVRPAAVDVIAVSFPRFDPHQAGPDGGDFAHVHTADGTISAHRATETGWQIGLTARHARSSIDLDGFAVTSDTVVDHDEARERLTDCDRAERPVLVVPRRATQTAGVPTSGVPPLTASLDDALQVELGESAYRQTEEPWHTAHAPRARLEFLATDTHLMARVTMHLGIDLSTEAATGALFGAGTPKHMPDNPLDNERADVNVSGVQWYSTEDGINWQDAGMVVPLSHTEGSCRATRLLPPSAAGALSAPPVTHWRKQPNGWQLQMAWPFQMAGPDWRDIRVQFVINEAVSGRERRLGQLALAGGGGFAYLRGDREAVTDTVTLRCEARPGAGSGTSGGIFTGPGRTTLG